MSDKGHLLDQLMASCLTQEIFMLEMILHLARQQKDPVNWARQFLKIMHGHIDAHEGQAANQDFSIPNLSRQSLFRLEDALEQLLDCTPQ